MKAVAEVRRRRRDLAELQALPLQEKAALTGELIARGLAMGRAAVLWSGGKDSTALLHMVRRQEPDIAVVWNDTGVEFPETRRFVRRMAGEWRLDLHVARPKPGVSFWWCAERYG